MRKKVTEHNKFLNINKIIRKFYNIKNIFKVEEWQKRNIMMTFF